jgi:hypothetical protein
VMWVFYTLWPLEWPSHEFRRKGVVKYGWSLFDPEDGEYGADAYLTESVWMIPQPEPEE